MAGTEAGCIEATGAGVGFEGGLGGVSTFLSEIGLVAVEDEKSGRGMSGGMADMKGGRRRRGEKWGRDGERGGGWEVHGDGLRWGVME